MTQITREDVPKLIRSLLASSTDDKAHRYELILCMQSLLQSDDALDSLAAENSSRSNVDWDALAQMLLSSILAINRHDVQALSLAIVMPRDEALLAVSLKCLGCLLSIPFIESTISQKTHSCIIEYIANLLLIPSSSRVVKTLCAFVVSQAIWQSRNDSMCPSRALLFDALTHEILKCIASEGQLGSLGSPYLLQHLDAAVRLFSCSRPSCHVRNVSTLIEPLLSLCCGPSINSPLFISPCSRIALRLLRLICSTGDQPRTLSYPSLRNGSVGAVDPLSPVAPTSPMPPSNLGATVTHVSTEGVCTPRGGGNLPQSELDSPAWPSSLLQRLQEFKSFWKAHVITLDGSSQAVSHHSMSEMDEAIADQSIGIMAGLFSFSVQLPTLQVTNPLLFIVQQALFASSCTVRALVFHELWIAYARFLDFRDGSRTAAEDDASAKQRFGRLVVPIKFCLTKDKDVVVCRSAFGAFRQICALFESSFIDFDHCCEIVRLACSSDMPAHFDGQRHLVDQYSIVSFVAETMFPDLEFLTADRSQNAVESSNLSNTSSFDSRASRASSPNATGKSQTVSLKAKILQEISDCLAGHSCLDDEVQLSIWQKASMLKRLTDIVLLCPELLTLYPENVWKIQAFNYLRRAHPNDTSIGRVLLVALNTATLMQNEWLACSIDLWFSLQQANGQGTVSNVWLQCFHQMVCFGCKMVPGDEHSVTQLAQLAEQAQQAYSQCRTDFLDHLTVENLCRLLENAAKSAEALNMSLTTATVSSLVHCFLSCVCLASRTKSFSVLQDLMLFLGERYFLRWAVTVFSITGEQMIVEVLNSRLPSSTLSTSVMDSLRSRMSAFMQTLLPKIPKSDVLPKEPILKRGYTSSNAGSSNQSVKRDHPIHSHSSFDAIISPQSKRIRKALSNGGSAAPEESATACVADDTAVSELEAASTGQASEGTPTISHMAMRQLGRHIPVPDNRFSKAEQRRVTFNVRNALFSPTKDSHDRHQDRKGSPATKKEKPKRASVADGDFLTNLRTSFDSLVSIIANRSGSQETETTASTASHAARPSAPLSFNECIEASQLLTRMLNYVHDSLSSQHQ